VALRAGTIFQDSPLPLQVWFRAIWAVTNQKAGINALSLQRSLGLGSYRTAWLMLHKLREAMVRPGRERLAGRVEVDETYVGGEEPGVRGRQTFKKALVVVAAEVRGRGIGRIRLRRVRDASAESIAPFVQDAVEAGTTLITDGLLTYPKVVQQGYRHEPRVILGSGRTASSLLPRVHRVASLLKRWLLGTTQGAVSPAHLDAYLEEFTFRFNRRTSRHRGKLFFRVLQQAVTMSPTIYRVRIRHIRGRKAKRTPRSGARAH
jgi:transposase-like protein